MRRNLLKFSLSHSKHHNLNQVIQKISPYKEQLFKHSIYANINSIPTLQIFMQNHVFAVWDFMALLKFIQNKVTCTQIPWIPASNPTVSRFFNEIVLSEESDEISKGVYLSHFELYLKVMEEIGSDTSTIRNFIEDLKIGDSWQKSLKNVEKNFLVSKITLNFVKTTLDLVESKPLHIIMAFFLYGREDPIPEMFQRIISTLQEKKINCSYFEKYLSRHISIDEQDHSPMAKNALLEVCGNNEQIWKDVGDYGVLAIQARIQLWDGIMEKINESKN